MSIVKDLTTFQAEIKRIDFKKSYGDNLITIVLEPCFITESEIKSQLVEMQQMEEGLFDVSIKKVNG